MYQSPSYNNCNSRRRRQRDTAARLQNESKNTDATAWITVSKTSSLLNENEAKNEHKTYLRYSQASTILSPIVSTLASPKALIPSPIRQSVSMANKNANEHETNSLTQPSLERTSWKARQFRRTFCHRETLVRYCKYQQYIYSELQEQYRIDLQRRRRRRSFISIRYCKRYKYSISNVVL